MTSPRLSTVPTALRARAAVVALGVMGLTFSFAPGASADSATLIAGKTAWFWLSNQKVTTCVDDPVIGVCGGASGNGGIFGNASGATTPISPGHLGVSMKDGNPDMDAYVFFKLPRAMRKAEVTKFVLTLTVSRPSDTDHSSRHASNQAKVPATSNEGQAAIQACAVTEPWGSAEGDPRYSTTVVRPHPESGDNNHSVTTVKNEPASDCSLKADGVPSADGKTWTFDITHIANRWTSGAMNNDGVALLPVPSTIAPTWTVEFHGAPATAVAADESTLTYVTPQEAARASVEFTPGSDDGGFIPPPPPGNIGGGGTVFPPVVDPGPVDPGTGPIDGGTTDPTPPQTGGGTVPVAFMGSTPWWFWGVLMLGFGGLWLMSRLVGEDPLAAVALFGGSVSRVASVLRSRRLSGEGAIPAAEAIASEEALAAEQAAVTDQ